MANAASATCAWSETSEEGLDRPTAPRGWSAGIFEWVFERLERQERSGAIGRDARKKDATVFRDGPESTRSTSARERRRVRRLESRVRPEKKKNTGIAFAMGPRGGARPRRERHRARLVACRHPSGSGESISRRGHARARTFSSRRAGSLRRSRAHRPRRRVGVSREGRRRDIFHVLQRLQRDFLFRVSARRLHGRVLNPQERCHRRVVLLQIRALFQNLRPHVEGRRGRVSGCPGTPGINSRWAKRETRKRVFVSRRLGVRRTASSEPATAFRSVSLGGSLRIPWGTMPKDAARVSK